MAKEHILIKKLDEFIRKYYKNRLIRGIIWTFAILTIYFLILIFGEYFFHFDQLVRSVLFFTFLGISGFLIVRLIIFPVLQLIRIGKVISYRQAADIVGNHFPDIQDKLLNTLQLINKSETAHEHSDLLTASIEQKTNSLKVFRFTMVIDFRKNLPYLRLALIPLIIILLIAILSPKIISDPTERIIRFDQKFTQPLPFVIEVLNTSFNAVQQEDFELKVLATGNEIPAEIFVKTKDVTYKMTKTKGFRYAYKFKSLQNNLPFKIIAGDYTSKSYEIIVSPKPIILGFEVITEFPLYIKRIAEKFENVGDLIVPEGTKLTWTFFTKDVGLLKLRMGENTTYLSKDRTGTFTFTHLAVKSTSYSLCPLNDKNKLEDSLVFNINVIGDGYPTIFVNESMDSILRTNVFYRGTIKDDYGFTRLTFNSFINKTNDSTGNIITSENIVIDKGINNQIFFYTVDLLKLMPDAGMKLSYFFEIWDNDGIRGPKSTKSEIKTISTPSLEEIVNQTHLNEKVMSEDVENSIKESKAMEKTMSELSRKMVDQNGISYQEKMKIEDILKANLKIEEKINEAIKQNEQNIQNEQKFLETSERITEKQRQLNELMKQLLTEDLKKMIQELKDLLKQVDKEKLGSLMEKMKVSNKDLEKQLDRNLSLMKQIEFDRKLEALSSELKKTAEQQEKLADKTLENRTAQEKLTAQQKEINQKVDTLAKNINDLEKEGKKLENPAEFGPTEEKKEEIRNSLNESQKNLEQRKNKDAVKSQKKAASQMRELAKQMEDSQQENEDEQLGEDATNIRMILENLVRLSFEQEDLIMKTRIIARSDPKYPEIVVKQRELGEKLNVIEDSLNAIAKRQIMMKPFVTKEISGIRKNISLTLEAMDSRNINVAVAKQQYSMTSINNLAVMLNESLDKMNEQMASSMQSKGGKKSCNKPSSKGGKSSMKGMKDLQDQIGQQLQRLKSGMDAKAGQSKGTKADQRALNQQIAKLAAQQEALRNEMQQYQDNNGSKGIKDQGALNEAAKEMERIEKDLINKNITQETILRQQKIMSRLLESEKAEQQREQEEKRESIEAKTLKISNPEQNFQYNIKKKMGFDNIQLTLPVISSFYKSKVNNYIVRIGN